ncbi:caspase recruitment domain-containing protein 8-like isoform X2 [Diceros bicornis minor]|uniref:caspase recruitment domain-containing protein 8-like isoform X2 n=1 Tax=Diceros bicornis minor TaxID=77932 RepID=UPI0026ED5EFE|nr:caspase recruitment domain-containing protein 8-like isoform X2 [Diceros bicornis minor]
MENNKSKKKTYKSKKWPLRWLFRYRYKRDKRADHHWSPPSEGLAPPVLGSHNTTYNDYQNEYEEDEYSSLSSCRVYPEEYYGCEIFDDVSNYGDVMTVKPSLHNITPEPELFGDEATRTPVSSIAEEDSTRREESGVSCSSDKQVVPSLAATLSSQVKLACNSNQFLGPGGIVDVELVDQSTNGYRIHLPTAGCYLWPATHLGFLVRAAVTVEIAFNSWGQHLDLDLQHHDQWMVAGPLFDISMEPGEAVAELHLPHVISLQDEVDVSWFQVAHFKEEGMILERPARVEPFYAVLENPSFSLMGILLSIARGTRLSVPITSTALIYCHLHPEDIKFHVYLIPSDSVLTKAIDDEEARFHGVRLQTSPPVEPLNFGSRYIVSSSAHLEIIPEELKLSYRSPGEIQPFSKVYAGKMKEPIELEITEKKHKTLVWKTLVKPVDLQFGAASAPLGFSGAAFVRQHHRQLQARMGDLNGVLDDLEDSEVLTENEKKLVEQEQTRQRKNETLLRLVRNKGDQALELLFRSLAERDPYLVSYLRQQYI